MSETKPAFDAERSCEAMAATVGLSISPEQRPGVIQFLTIAHRMAMTVALAPLDAAAFEPAPVFRAGGDDPGAGR